MSSDRKMGPWRTRSEDESNHGPGYVIIIGRTMAGKSSLLSAVVEQHSSLIVGFGTPLEFRLTNPKRDKP